MHVVLKCHNLKLIHVLYNYRDLASQAEAFVSNDCKWLWELCLIKGIQKGTWTKCAVCSRAEPPITILYTVILNITQQEE